MVSTPVPEGILLVDDGELDHVAAVLDEQGLAYTRLRGGRIPDEIPPPRDLLIVTPRRVERVRRGSPPEARPGRPLRIIAVDEDSPAMRRRLRRSGLHLLIRLPTDPEIWRLLIARALYRGSERRTEKRVAVGTAVDFEGPADARQVPIAPRTTLIDLSNRGCRLETEAALSVGDPIVFSLPAEDDSPGAEGPLELRGQIRRISTSADGTKSSLAILFDEDLSEDVRVRLTAVINRWAAGPTAPPRVAPADVPALPPCRMPSLPDLTLDDETDPPICSRSNVEVSLASADADAESAREETPRAERREQPRGRYATTVEAVGGRGPFVLIGRDLSSGGMRIERHPDLAIGQRFRLALRGPHLDERVVVEAEIVRDDGERGFGLAFDRLGKGLSTQLEKMVASLPDVESLEDGEMGGLGAVLSEVLDV